MKKEIIKKIVPALFITLSCLNVFAQSADPSPANQMSGDTSSGLIRELAGLVELKTPSASSFIQARVGDEVAEQTIISTGFKSSALLEVGSVFIVVRPLTRLTLTDIRTSREIETLNVYLHAGRVRVDLNPPAGTRASMNVVSPVAVSSVRGTSFEVDTHNLVVLSGKVSFIGSYGQRVSIIAGSSIGIREDGSAINPAAPDASSIRPPIPEGIDQTSTPVTVADTGYQINIGSTDFGVLW